MLKYAIFEFKQSSQVKSDPAILTGSKKHGCSQNLKSLTRETNFLAKWYLDFTILKYAIFGSKMSSQVKSDPSILTGSKKHSQSQNLKSLAQETKIWCTNVISRRFGRQPFNLLSIQITKCSMILPIWVDCEVDSINKSW